MLSSKLQSKAAPKMLLEKNIIFSKSKTKPNSIFNDALTSQFSNSQYIMNTPVPSSSKFEDLTPQNYIKLSLKETGRRSVHKLSSFKNAEMGTPIRDLVNRTHKRSSFTRIELNKELV